MASPAYRVISADSHIVEPPELWTTYMDLLQRLDHFYGRYRFSRNEHLAGDRMPSEVFQGRVWATFIRDRAGVKLLDEIGARHVVWSSDYPHGDSTWPRSQAFLDEHFAGVDPQTRDRVVCGNAAALYGFS